MMNILMVNFPAEGHVNPTLGIVKAFADRGDNVHYITTEKFKERLSFLMPEKEFKNILGPDSFQPDENAERLLDQMKEKFDVLPKNMLQFMNNSGDLNLVYTSRYFQPHNELFGENYVFIGPSFPQRKTTDHFPMEVLKDKKVLYISMGTVLDHVEEFFNTCIDAFSDFEGKVVIAAGEKADFTKIKEAPENFIISPYVPQLEILSQSDVIVTHGGMNSVNEAIHYNVPLVVIPHDKDQPMVAQRLTELGAGYRISKDNINVSSLKNAVNEVLSNSEYKEAIQKIKDSFHMCGGPEKAIEV
ncbi:nucleotide disphospho-sugar-binding domain-containing protein, partial [Paenibacillus zanthoxyli]|uniref:nucleotide disphospho-sugar-binding domain-containing protein n=1 Tax=Paenibacillus zanthoxyli TaxID=369399 RepID=UPI00056D1661